VTHHALLMTGESNITQVHQARAEARAEAEAAAEQRSAAALEQQRAELVKQARSWLCTCGNGVPAALPWPALCRLCTQHTVSVAAVHAMRAAAWACMYWWAAVHASARPIMLCHALLTEKVRLGVASTH